MFSSYKVTGLILGLFEDAFNYVNAGRILLRISIPIRGATVANCFSECNLQIPHLLALSVIRFSSNAFGKLSTRRPACRSSSNSTPLAAYDDS